MVTNLPVLILFFNRVDILPAMIEVLRKVAPPRLYLASDGPRFAIAGEDKQVSAAREYMLTNIDWECDVYTLFRSDNLGCKYAVHGAIQWFFSHEQKGVVLEDDIVPTENFFHFCEAMLDIYQNDERIGSVTGRNELGVFNDEDWFFASRFQCWGWASWADRINEVDVEYGYNKDLVYDDLFEGVGWEEHCYIKCVLGLLQTNQVNSWAYAYDLYFRRQNKLQIYPKYNMVANIGFAHDGTHSFSRQEDGIPVHHRFLPDFSSTYDVADDIKYIKAKLRSEYGGPIRLILMSQIRRLRWLRKIRSAVIRSVRRLGDYRRSLFKRK